jgi:hypothetical protein
VKRFYGSVRKIRQRKLEDFRRTAMVTESIVSIIWGLIPAGPAMNAVAREYNISLPEIRNDIGMNILSNIAVESFSNSNPANKPHKGRPLGQIAINLVEYYTGLEEPEAFSLLEEPFLHAYGSIEQLYLDLLKQAKRIDTVESGN